MENKIQNVHVNIISIPSFGFWKLHEMTEKYYKVPLKDETNEKFVLDTKSSLPTYIIISVQQENIFWDGKQNAKQNIRMKS